MMSVQLQLHGAGAGGPDKDAVVQRNVALYERLGFEHLGEFNLGSSPPLRPMPSSRSALSA